MDVSAFGVFVDSRVGSIALRIHLENVFWRYVGVFIGFLLVNCGKHPFGCFQSVH